MKRIALIVAGLLLGACGSELSISPQAVAGVYALSEVKVDPGNGRVLIYRKAEENPPSGFIELNSDRTYRLFVSYGSPNRRVWEENGNYGVNSKFEIAFATSGRNFSGLFFNRQSRIAVTESLFGAVVLMVFDRA